MLFYINIVRCFQFVAEAATRKDAQKANQELNPIEKVSH